HDERARILVLHHERLDDRVLVDLELSRRFGGAAVLDVVVAVLAEVDVVAAQELRGGGFAAAHGPLACLSLCRGDHYSCAATAFRKLMILICETTPNAQC